MSHFSKFTSIFALAFTAALGCAGCMTEVDEPTEETEAGAAIPEESTATASEALSAGDDDCYRTRRGDGWYEYDCNDRRGGWWWDDDDDDDWWYDTRGRRRNDRCDKWDCNDDDWVRLRRHRNRHHDNGRRGHGRGNGDHW